MFRAHPLMRRADLRDLADEDLMVLVRDGQARAVEAARREQSTAVRGALAALPQEQRQVIELAYFGGFSHSQIADMLGAPVGTIKGRMRLGLAKLRLSLGDRAEVVV